MTKQFWEIFSEVGFGMVILGVLLEGADLIEQWRDRRAKQRVTEHKKPWPLLVETVGFAILVSGLAMEFIGSHKAMDIADHENAVLNKQAEELRKKNLELEAAIQPRSISQIQRDTIISRLRSVLNKCDVVVVADSSNVEATRFAADITDLLQSCGFDAKLSTGLTLPGSGAPIRTGLHFVTGASVSASADALLNAFRGAGVEAIRYTSNPGLGVINHVDIFVNAKPLHLSSTNWVTNSFAVPAGPQPE